MTVKLTNPNKVPFIIALYHAEYCKNGGPCNCRKMKITRSTDTVMLGGVEHPGQVTTQSKFLSATLTIAGKTKKTGLHSAIMKVSQVQEALRTRVLKGGREQELKPAPEIIESTQAAAPTSQFGGVVHVGEDKEPRSKTRKSSRKGKKLT